MSRISKLLPVFFSSFFAFIAAISFFKTKHKLCGLFYMVLCIFFIFICGEEISWGQRIFGIKSPEYFLEHNVQKEINLHNLDIAHYIVYGLYAILGFFGAFAWVMLPRVVSPLPTGKRACEARVRGRFSIVNIFVPDWFLMFYFIPVFLIYLYFCVYGFAVLFFGIKPFIIENGYFIVWRDQEPAELLLSLGFLFFVVTNYMKLRK